MKIFIFISGICVLLYLLFENKRTADNRKALLHIIHVNGTRGKSGVSRLITAGLSEGGYKVYCKTTGTVPMVIDTAGNERELRRRGPANISEQIKIMNEAVKDGAEILVIECMALDPELQYVSQHKILKADIGVITNVRIDHIAEMGSDIESVCNALCNTLPQNGLVFTSDRDCFEIIKNNAEQRGSRAFLADKNSSIEEDEWFPENIELALSVCKAVGIPEDTAIVGMQKVKKDPFSVNCCVMKNGTVFLDAMSANDPQSTRMIYNRFISKNRESFIKTVIVLNLRNDRGYRSELMADLILEKIPDEVIMIGDINKKVIKSLEKHEIKVRVEKDIERIFDHEGKGTLIFAIGNIKDKGSELSDYAKNEGMPYVW